MSETFTLERLFEAFPGGIRIPRIQRGYVQGRDDEKGKEIRANFVPKLVDAVFNGKDLSLDFIYGVAGSDGEGRRCLLPLDGQQRLTTLFLLAWLCGKWNREWHFSYESRRIPQLFVEGLMAHSYKGTDKPSAKIENESWFLPVWKDDPTVAGMLLMLDALHDAIDVIKVRDCSQADLERITFLLHGIEGRDETFDHIFRKMNARGKELSPWENLKAMLDKYLPNSLADEWRVKIDGEWSEAIWKHADGVIAKLDNAMEKIVRMAYARCAGVEAQKDSLWDIEMRICGKLDERERSCLGFYSDMLEKFFQIASRYFEELEQTAPRWTADRAANTLWGGSSDGGEFWNWLSNGNSASIKDLLRMSFLTEPAEVSDAERRRRVLLNLLDATTGINGENFSHVLSIALDYLVGELDIIGIGERKAGFSTEQLEDEKRKWKLDAARIVEVEKDELVYHGSLRFIGWADFKNEDDVCRRLESVRSGIRNDWIGFYCNLAARISEDAIGEREYVHTPVRQDDIATWRDKILSSRYFIKALVSWHASSAVPETIPYWVIHLCELLSKGKAEYSSLRKFDGWMFLLQNKERRSPSGKSIRLDYNDKERSNRQLLKDGEIYYANPWPWVEAKDGGEWFNVCHETWWTCVNPPHVPRNADGTFPETTNSM